MSTLKTNNIQHVDRSDPSIIINTDGGVSIAGTLTYEDVTSVDAVGIVTAREILNAQKQVHVGTGVSVKAGGINVTAGITTVQALQATTGTFSAAVSGTTGTFTGDVDIADKIVHTGDTNTAIRFPSADTFTVETAGNERVRVDSNGSFLIGNTSSLGSSYPLQVFDDTDVRMVIGNTTAASSQDSTLFFLPANSVTGATIKCTSEEDFSTSANRTARLTFSTRKDGTTAERLRIDSSGRVLIGTTTEGFATADNFTISDTTTDCGMTIRAGSSSQSIIAFSDGTSGTAEYAGYLSYYHSTDELHIGALAKPIVKIHDEYFNIYANEGTTRMNFGFTDTNGGELSIYDDTGAQKIRICGSTSNNFFNNGGDVLIGTTSDASLANFGSSTGGLLLDNVGANNTAVGLSHDSVELFLGADANAGYLWQDTDHELLIGTNSTSRVIITAGGQMGLGEVSETAIRNNGAGNKTYLVISKGNGSGNAPNTYNADEEYIHLGGREWGTVNSSKYGHYYMGLGYTNGVTGDHSPCAIGFYETTTSGYTKGNFTIRTRSYTNSNSTTSDRLIVQSNGNVTTIEGGFSDRTQAGFTARKDDSVSITRANGSPMEVNRQSNDGNLITFYQGNSSEGNISVSGTTVSYNGGHLSRWSQLQGISTTDKSARPTIYQGTVMSNLDELCSWERAAVLYTEEEKEDGVIPEGKDVGDIKHAAYTEDNQQLNMSKVSDVEGDKDVAGVFWTWDDDDDEIVNDFYIAMTGDMVIRVAASTTVQRGDLLISAGDGTAKPQADDIIRSSTIAKIISTNHTATYADGSKAYPCVLMAC